LDEIVVLLAMRNMEGGEGEKTGLSQTNHKKNRLGWMEHRMG
jgi:hypothetical protein